MNKNLSKILVLITLNAFLLIACEYLFAKNSQPQTVERKSISEVRYFGLQNITPRDLEPLLPFSPGDPWRSELATQIQKIVSDYYAKRGFYFATSNVVAQLKEDKTILLRIEVEENKPCIVKSFKLSDPPAFTNKHVKKRFKDRMNSFVGVQSGQRYDEQNLADKLRLLREWLITENFIVANTDTVSLNFNDDHTEVDVEVKINFGDRVTFGFQNNSVFTSGELNEFILQLRATDLGKDYIGIIRRKFIEEFKNRSFNNVEIRVKITELEYKRHVTFYFDEGIRSKILDIKWEGMSKENTQIAAKVFLEGVSRYVQRNYYVEKDVDKGILIVLEDLKARGFLSSRLISKNVKQVKTKSKEYDFFHITVQMAEGEQTLVGKIELAGFQYFKNDKILAELKLVQGNPFNPFALEEGLQRIKTLYVHEGFLDFRFLTPDEEIVTFSENNRTASVRLGGFEGLRIKVGQIELRGYQLTRKHILQREIAIDPEDYWLYSKISDTETNLRKLGLFSSVKISPKDSSLGPMYRDLIIDVKEADPGAFEVGPGFRSDLGLRGFSRVSYNNLFGKNWVISFGTEANRRINDQYRFIEYNFDVNFLEPSFFGTRNLYSIGVSARKQRFPPDFNASTTQLTTGFERRLFNNLLSINLFYSLERIRQFDVYVNGLYSDTDNQTLLIGSIKPSIIIDSRDSPFTTTKGQVSRFNFDYASPRFASRDRDDRLAVGYVKWTGSTHWYFPLTKNIVWSNVVAGGFQRSNIAGKAVPLVKLFRLGGYSNIRGFFEDSINVDSVKLNGTLHYLNFRSQFDLPFFGDLRFAPFIDAGNLFIDGWKRRITVDSNTRKEIGTPFLRVGVGAGLHYLTPIGPINFDYGIKLNRYGTESAGQFHFSVGFI